jgi:hypothetical protein
LVLVGVSVASTWYRKRMVHESVPAPLSGMPKGSECVVRSLRVMESLNWCERIVSGMKRIESKYMPNTIFVVVSFCGAATGTAAPTLTSLGLEDIGR